MCYRDYNDNGRVMLASSNSLQLGFFYIGMASCLSTLGIAGVSCIVRHTKHMERLIEFCEMQNGIILNHTESCTTAPRHIAFRFDKEIGLYIAITEKTSPPPSVQYI